MEEEKGSVWLVMASLFAAIIACPLYGFVLAKAWGWFLVPAGLRPIGIAQAVGIGVVASMLTSHLPGRRDEKTGEVIGRVLLGPLACWLIGSVAHHFMW